ncbi:hypothetical protein BDA96_01G016900 [Sorghum bicolor]|uniref:Uncharacterized protein n=1 Tax=Sorghum bicolor TaxID=4558 RepID=A0A921UYR9_SORBI|nr:hypothetical protein BDA96_01G016900 [Sorghum bicolor]
MMAWRGGIHDYRRRWPTFRTRRCTSTWSPCMLTSITISHMTCIDRYLSRCCFVVGLDISECAFVHRPAVLCFCIHQIVFVMHDMIVRTRFALFRSSDSSALSSRQ